MVSWEYMVGLSAQKCADHTMGLYNIKGYDAVQMW